MTNNKATKPTTSQTNDDRKDLEEHGVKDIIPENEEYYTLNLNRTFDEDKDEDKNLGADVATGNPLAEGSDETGEVIDKGKDYRPESSNQGGPHEENNISDQDDDSGTQVGEAGHPGIDDKTG